MREFGSGWVRGEDGLHFRTAARVIPFDLTQRALLIRGHDEQERQRSWWFTVGGGVDAGERIEDAAVRELHEETGILVSTRDLIGPVVHRHAILDYRDVTARQEEWFFLTFMDRGDTAVHNEHWTDHEHQTLDEMRWWDIDDLEQERANREIFPDQLVTHLRQWADHGWDGNLITITDEFFPAGT